MGSFTVILPKGSRAEALQKFLREKYKESSVVVKKDDPPESRNDRLGEVESELEDAKSEVEALKTELEEWRENLPENLQSGTKADELGDAISELESIESSLDDAIGGIGNVSFPSMY